MNCTNPRPIKPFKHVQNSLGAFESPALYVDCGKCLACRVNKTREWTLRLTHEANIAETCYFITLTYDEEHLPVDGSVHKEDVVDFISNLRKICGPGIRYFFGSEYGEEDSATHRPHYHGLVFNVPDWLRTEPCSSAYRVETRRGKSNSISFVNTYYNDIWRRGFVTVGLFHPRRASYLARYYVDKGTAPKGKSPNFNLMSRRPGIGAEYFSSVFDKVVSGRPLLSEHGTRVGLPRYYRKLIQRETGLSFDQSLLAKVNEQKLSLVEKGLAKDCESINEKNYLFFNHKNKQI